jgi:hypothetical protein
MYKACAAAAFTRSLISSDPSVDRLELLAHVVWPGGAKISPLSV